VPDPLFSQQALAPYTQGLANDSGAASGIPTSAPESKGIGKAPYLAQALGSAGDTLSTMYKLGQGGVRETNPALGSNPSNGKLLLASGVEGIAVPLLMRYLANHGDGGKAAAKLIGYSLGGVHGAAAVHNMMLPSPNK